MRFVLIALLTFVTATAVAHTHLQKSVPAADSTAPAPSEFVLQFSEPTQLTALIVEKEGGAPIKVEPLPAKVDKELHVAAPKLAPGVYVIKWRGVGDDTHVMSGSLRFTVQ